MTTTKKKLNLVSLSIRRKGHYSDRWLTFWSHKKKRVDDREDYGEQRDIFLFFYFFYCAKRQWTRDEVTGYKNTHTHREHRHLPRFPFVVPVTPLPLVMTWALFACLLPLLCLLSNLGSTDRNFFLRNAPTFFLCFLNGIWKEVYSLLLNFFFSVNQVLGNKEFICLFSFVRGVNLNVGLVFVTSLLFLFSSTKICFPFPPFIFVFSNWEWHSFRTSACSYIVTWCLISNP